VVRPFLDVPREAVIRSLQQHRLGYRLDTSNVDIGHARNRVRRDVIPLLEGLQPETGKTLGRTAALLTGDADFILNEAVRVVALSVLDRGPDWVRVSTASLLSLHPALRSHVVRVLVEEVAGQLVDISEIHIRQVIQAIERLNRGVVASLPHDLAVEVAGDSLVFRRKRGEPPHPTFDYPLSIPGTLRTPAWQLEVTLSAVSDRDELRRQVVVCGPWQVLCDAERLGPNLRVRSRQPGDRIIPLGMTGSRKVQDVFVDAHIPRDARDATPLVANERHVVWIPGLVVDTRTVLGDTTHHVAHLVYRRISR
jgi:tRNA(Ile)-lysidine synthase